MDTPSQPTGATIAPPAFAIGITLVLVGLIPAVGFAVLPSFLGQRRRAVDLGPIAAFPEDEFVVTTFLADPQAGEVSRRAAYVRNIYSVRRVQGSGAEARIHAFALSDPGQPVTGPESLLYPFKPGS